MSDKDKDPNEDFKCMFCWEEVPRRYLFCNQECEDQFNQMVAL